MKLIRTTVILVIFIMLAGKSANAQETLYFAQVNEQTYSFYLKGDWKSLIKLGKQAQKAGIDFYYLQVRMGISYYNQKKYRQALPYLERALKESPGDEFVMEYLYYAYIFSGRKPDARNLAYDLSPQIKEKLKIETPVGLSGIGLETKFDQWDDYKAASLTSDTIQQSVQDSYNYFGGSFDFTTGKGNKIYLSYSRSGLSETSNWLNSSNQMVISDRQIGQNQFYFSSQSRTAKGFNMIFSGNLLFLSLKQDITIVESSLKSGTGFGPGSGGGIIGGPGGIFSAYNALQASNLDFIGYFALSQDFSLFRAGISGSVSGLDNNLQLQSGFNLTFYPFGNTNVYTQSFIYFAFEKTDFGKESRGIFKQSVGVNFWGLYLEPSVSIGRLTNFIEEDAYVVNNSSDIPYDRFEVLTYTSLFKGKLNLFVKYQNFMRQNYYIANNVTQTTDYQYQTITGGIKWNF